MEYVEVVLTEAIPSSPGVPNGVPAGQKGKLKHRERVEVCIRADGKICLGTIVSFPEEERVEKDGRKITIVPWAFVSLDALKPV